MALFKRRRNLKTKPAESAPRSSTSVVAARPEPVLEVVAQAPVNLAGQHANASVDVGRQEMIVSTRLAGGPTGPLTGAQAGDASSGYVATTSVMLGNPDYNLVIDRLSAVVNAPLGNSLDHLSFGSNVGLLYGNFSTVVNGTNITGFGAGIGKTGAFGLTAIKDLHNVGIGGGVTATVTGDASLRAIGYHENRYQLEYQETRSAGLRGFFGVYLGHFGGGMTLAGSGQHSSVYRTWRDGSDTSMLLRQHTPLRAFLSLLHLCDPVLVPPNVADPLNKQVSKKKNQAPFLVGDEMHITFSGTLTWGGVASLFGVNWGAHLGVTGTDTIEVYKKSETEVEVVVMLKNISRTMALSTNIPALAAAGYEYSKSQATRHHFSFNLQDPEPLEEFENIFRKGHIPGHVPDIKNYTVLDPKSAQQSVAAATLKDGVNYVNLEQASIPKEHSRHVSFLSLLGLIPFTPWAEIGKQIRHGQEQSVVADAETAVFQSTVRTVKELQRFRNGIFSRESYGAMATTYARKDERAKVMHVRVGSFFTADRFNPDTMNQIIEQLNGAYSAADIAVVPLPKIPSDVPKTKYDYALRLEQVIPLTTLEQITPNGTTPQEYGESLQKKVAKKGLKEVLELGQQMQRRAESTPELRVTIQSAAPDALEGKVRGLCALYGSSKLNPFKQSRKDISARIKAVDKYRRRIAKIRQGMEQDPMLNRLDPQSKVEQTKSLEASEQALMELVEVRHLNVFQYANLKSTVSPSVREILIKWEKELSGHAGADAAKPVSSASEKARTLEPEQKAVNSKKAMAKSLPKIGGIFSRLMNRKTVSRLRPDRKLDSEKPNTKDSSSLKTAAGAIAPAVHEKGVL